MAMIFDLGLPSKDLEAISTFMKTEGESDVPELEGDSALALNALTTLTDPDSLWRTVVGRFVPHSELGEATGRPDILYIGGERTEQTGIVEQDLEQPTGVYYIGAPM